MIMRSAIILSMLAGTALIAAPAFVKTDIRVLWNASASVPVGLYRIVPVEQIESADIAVVVPPDDLATFLDQRGYLPKGVPLLKRVLALSGTEVCRIGSAIIVHDMSYGRAHEHDSQGRPLPVWQGCRTLAGGEAFFMNWDSPDSFDSRYFGPLPVKTIIGKALPLWTRDSGDELAPDVGKPALDAP
ncbi:S26 family signal peptidase [Brucellaceae bacterium D45D]